MKTAKQIIKDVKFEMHFAIEYAKYKRRIKKHSKALEGGLDLQEGRKQWCWDYNEII